MVLRRALLLVVLCGFVSGRCPTTTCASLASNICMQQTTANAYTVNSDGCNSDSTCNLSAYISLLTATSVTSTTSTTNSLSCVTTPTSTDTQITWKPMNCETQLPAKVWSNGGTQLLCQDDSDCLMQDGTWTTCVCVPREDKNGVCQPHHSNTDVFSGYWYNCGLNNVIAEEVAYSYWVYALDNWVYTQSDLSCSDIFYEIGQYDTLYGHYEAAEAVVFAALLFLA